MFPNFKDVRIDNTALGVKAGFTGNYVEDYLKEKRNNH